MKSADILKETSKNSYSNKYLGDYSRNKLNSKNSSNTNLKVKFDIKDKNKKAINKKAKNNSMDKNSTIELHNKFFEADKNKKKTRNLSNNSFSNNYNNTTKDKFSKTASQISLYKNLYNNSSIEPKNKIKKITQEKKLNDNKIINIPEIKNISQKEKACLILAFSKCLRLTERVFFSLSSPKLKEAISKKKILDTHKIYLKEKLEELEEKINICDNKLQNKFSASKTAEITLNFVTLNYEKIESNMLIKNLYNKIEEKNYKNIKDYLFYLYIQNKDENKSLENVDKINQIIKTTPDVLSFKVTAKLDKFILYTSVIVNEIINFAKERLDTMKLKKDCKKIIDIINLKLNLFKRKTKTN